MNLLDQSASPITDAELRLIAPARSFGSAGEPLKDTRRDGHALHAKTQKSFCLKFRRVALPRRRARWRCFSAEDIRCNGNSVWYRLNIGRAVGRARRWAIGCSVAWLAVLLLNSQGS